MLKASWISAIDQPWALLMGLTNKVQPYCRLAISTMHMMPTISWVQRVAEEAITSDDFNAVVEAAIVVPRPDPSFKKTWYYVFHMN